ncbi:hypothetical protein HYC85_018017 [Camellia sinensis]|uniref:glucose-1-phosphate adenylyltransferase n=1 Tax=Camellia sinensis TaxID=4442 RepID=A0A7J7GTD0_CAMSI|nr:hypothetical protein HYC85_018017 [Camellia sinensis]
MRGRSDLGFLALLLHQTMAKRLCIPIKILTHPGLRDEERTQKNVATIILGGGPGTQLFPLTIKTITPAIRNYFWFNLGFYYANEMCNLQVPLGGCYRLIDIPMSNYINSGINKIFVLTQFNYVSLNRHLACTYFGNGVNFGDGFVEPLEHRGKQDAKIKDVENILILSGDHLYRIDYMDFLQNHINKNADITISCVPVGDSHDSDYGLMKIDHHGRIIQFAKKTPRGTDHTNNGINPGGREINF